MSNETAGMLSRIVASIRESVRQHSRGRFTQGVVATSHTSFPPDAIAALGHVLYMCDMIDGFIVNQLYDKANRWIGFAQGVLWIFGVASINDSRNVNIRAAREAHAEALFENGDPYGSEKSHE